MRRIVRILVLLAVGVLAAGALWMLGDDERPDGEARVITVPEGASLASVADTLAGRGILLCSAPVVECPTLFRLYARLKGQDRGIHVGRYAFRPGEEWSEILDALTTGDVLTARMTIPEGFTLSQMAPRIARVSELPADSVAARILADSAHVEWGVPGPGLEGYLFPDTYEFMPGSSLETILDAMVDRYLRFWTAERRARLDSLEMTEREIATLASIIQAEARKRDEMPVISSVYHNRLERGIALQADPTVLYALGGRRERLLFAAIDSVANNPYNTYTNPGLPPGPIGAPGEQALEAALDPADTEFFYFVARPDGSHVFTRSLREHNRAVAQARAAWDAARDSARARSPGLDSVPPEGRGEGEGTGGG